MLLILLPLYSLIWYNITTYGTNTTVINAIDTTTYGTNTMVINATDTTTYGTNTTAINATDTTTYVLFIMMR